MNAKAFVIPAIFRAIDDFSRPIKNMQRNVSDFERSMRKANMGMNNLYRGLGGNYGTLAISAGLYGVATGFKDVAKAAADAEMSIAGFTPMMGSAAKAQQLFNELQQFAVKSPYVYSDLGASASALLPMVKGDIKQLMDLMNMVGEISGGKADRLFANAVNLSQIIGKGKPDMVDMKQFATQLVPMYQMLEKSMGIEAAKIQASFHTGKKKPGELTIRSADIIQALKVATSEGGMYFNAMSIANKTLEGQMNALNEQWRLTKMTIGLTFLPLLKDYAHEAIRITQNIKDWAVAHKELISQKMNSWLSTIANAVRFLINNYETIITVVKYWGIALISTKVIISAITLATNGYRLAMFFLNTSIKAVIITQKAFGIGALAASGWVGALVAILGIAALKWYEYSNSMTQAQEAAKMISDGSASQQVEINGLFRTLKNTSASSQEYRDALEKIREISPSLVKAYGLEYGGLQKLIGAERELIDLVKERALLQGYTEAARKEKLAAIETRGAGPTLWDKTQAFMYNLHQTKDKMIAPEAYMEARAQGHEERANKYINQAEQQKIIVRQKNDFEKSPFRLKVESAPGIIATSDDKRVDIIPTVHAAMDF